MCEVRGKGDSRDVSVGVNDVNVARGLHGRGGGHAGVPVAAGVGGDVELSVGNLARRVTNKTGQIM